MMVNNGDIIKLSRTYHIEGKFASGGFGEIFVAKAEGNETVVIKLIPKMPGADRELLFEELTGVPNVIQIIERGEWGDFWVIVMPKAEKSLSEYLVEYGGKLDVRDVLNILIDINTALMRIEGKIVHRDLKPDNILLFDGKWCLTDFGIARYAEATTAPDTQKYSMTPPYAAPEQWRGERATIKTDVYAMGVVAYEMISGQKPFIGPEIHNFREQHLEQVPPLLKDVPIQLQSLISECLYKAVEARPNPANIMERLKISLKPASEASTRLQRMSLIEIEKTAEKARQESTEENEMERQSSLFRAAKQGLEIISVTFHKKIIEAAPNSSNQRGMLWPCTLGEARIEISVVEQAKHSYSDVRYQAPFEIIAYSLVQVRIPRNDDDYEGRAHSLWFCDAKDKGVFRWYETAFMIDPFIPKRKRSVVNPFALDPEQDAFGAISPGMVECQVAWPFTAIDQGNEEEFFERWMNWFTIAAEGTLQNPSHMPEKPAQDSWRKS